MKAYSEDLRIRIVHCVASGQDVIEVAKRFEVSPRTVERYLKQQRARGDRAPKKHPGRQPLLSEAQVEALHENLGEEPGLTLAERCDWLHEHEGVILSVPTMHRWVKRLGYSRNHAPMGERAHAGFLRNFGLNRTLLAALSLGGGLPCFLVDGGLTREVFEYYLRELLLPSLGSGQVLVLDNYVVHKGEGVEQLASE